MVELPRPATFQQAIEVMPAAQHALRTDRSRTIKRIALALALLTGTTAGAYYGHEYWTTGRFLQSTDDAYVKADYTTIAPKVPGYIADVLVQDNEAVKAGQVLAHIDDRDFRAALGQAQADVGAAEAAIRNLDVQIDLQQAEIAQARAAVAATQASLTFANVDADRYRDLVRSGSGTVQRAQQTEASRGQFTAQLQHDQAAATAAERKVAVLTSARGQAEAQRDRALAAQQQAELNLSYTTILAPVDGTVGARSLRIGQYVGAGTQLMAVVPMHAVYVVANFKETQLTHMRGGEPVEIEVDGFPGVRLKGHVDSLSPASGLEFALLPPDNATGNFTKIVQRIPVRITIDDIDLAGLLRSGMSVEPTVDTKATVKAERDDSTKLLHTAQNR